MTVRTTPLLITLWALTVYHALIVIHAKNSPKVWVAVGYSVLALSLAVFFGLLITLTWEILL